MRILVKSIFQVSDEIRVMPSQIEHRVFSYTVDSASATVTIADNRTLVSVIASDASDGLITRLNAGDRDTDSWPTPAFSEWKTLLGLPNVAARRLLYALKYHLGNYNLEDALATKMQDAWSQDGENWRSFPNAIHMAMESCIVFPRFDEAAYRSLQSLLESPDPIVTDSLRHLHRAKNDRVPRHKWIDATIAAELAIKEFLITIRPENRTLLLEVPSPPIRKLYGSVLESFTGQRSPKLKQLSNGADKRNELIHRPETIVALEEALVYVNDVEAAIFHLISLRRPNDSVVAEVLKLRSELSPLGSKRSNHRKS